MAERATSDGSPHAGTTAVVTGGTQGLGFAVAERLVAEGCRRLALAARSEEKGRAAVKALEAAGAEAHFLETDMGEADQAASLVDRAASRIGPVNALVNGAALTDRGSIRDTSAELWDRLMAVNARGPFLALQCLANRAVEGGHSASCVNILSMELYCGKSFLAPYAASKAALATVTRNAAQALRYDRIRVNAINCGWMDTPAEDAIQRRYHGAEDGWLARAEAEQPFGQLIKPGHVAELCAYLLGPRSGVMTGAAIDFDQYVAGAYPE